MSTVKYVICFTIAVIIEMIINNNCEHDPNSTSGNNAPDVRKPLHTWLYLKMDFYSEEAVMSDVQSQKLTANTEVVSALLDSSAENGMTANQQVLRNAVVNPIFMPGKRSVEDSKTMPLASYKAHHDSTEEAPQGNSMHTDPTDLRKGSTMDEYIDGTLNTRVLRGDVGKDVTEEVNPEEVVFTDRKIELIQLRFSIPNGVYGTMFYTFPSEEKDSGAELFWLHRILSCVGYLVLAIAGYLQARRLMRRTTAKHPASKLRRFRPKKSKSRVKIIG